MIQGGLLGFWSVMVPGAATILAVMAWRLIRRGRDRPTL